MLDTISRQWRSPVVGIDAIDSCPAAAFPMVSLFEISFHIVRFVRLDTTPSPLYENMTAIVMNNGGAR